MGGGPVGHAALLNQGRSALTFLDADREKCFFLEPSGTNTVGLRLRWTLIMSLFY